jgi:organic hydroperoxide reductase OsmC/OhrA
MLSKYLTRHTPRTPSTTKVKEHHYTTETKWIGNDGTGTSTYQAYRRDHEISAPGKSATVPGSSDPHFRGDSSRYNPEELLVASLSTCHMLWMLHLCASAGIVVTDYTDAAEGVMRENPDGSGEFVSVTLHPRITITDASKADEARALNGRVHDFCFIARSVNFPVKHEPEVIVR